MKKLLLLSCAALFGATAQAQNFYGGTNTKIVTFNVGTETITNLGTIPSSCIGPLFNLTDGGNNKLYGIRSQPMYGGLFSYDMTTNAVECLYDFTNVNAPWNNFDFGMLVDNGKLYGTTQEGIFSIDLATNAFTEVTNFGTFGNKLSGRLVKASNGLLYGVAADNGANSEGFIYTFNPATNAVTNVYDLATATGTQPTGSLIAGNNGLLYGVTAYGGVNEIGVIFSFNTNTNAYTKLFDFVQTTGEGPATGLMLGQDGNFYGVTMTGGTNYQGTLYQFNPNTNAYTMLHAFFAGDGYNPRVTPTQAANGKLYGTTDAGGANFNGTLYSYDLATSTFTKVIDFGDSTGVNTRLFSLEEANGMATLNAGVNNLNIFPNPASDEATVSFTATNDAELNVYNAFGQLVKHETISKQNGKQTIRISTKAFAPGLYNIKIGNVSTKLIVE